MYLIRDFHCLNKLAEARQPDLEENVSFYSKVCHVIIRELVSDRNKIGLNLQQNGTSGLIINIFPITNLLTHTMPIIFSSVLWVFSSHTCLNLEIWTFRTCKIWGLMLSPADQQNEVLLAQKTTVLWPSEQILHLHPLCRVKEPSLRFSPV